MPDMTTARTLWFAFIVSQLVFLVVVNVGLTDPPELDWAVVGPLAAVAMFEGVFGLVGVPAVFRKQPAQSAWIIRWAFFEAMTITGLVTAFVGAPLALFYGLFGLSLVCLALTRPTADAFTEWEMRRLQ